MEELQKKNNQLISLRQERQRLAGSYDPVMIKRRVKLSIEINKLQREVEYLRAVNRQGAL